MKHYTYAGSRRHTDDPEAFGIVSGWANQGNLTLRLYIHLKFAKEWKLYETLRFTSTTECVEYANTLYPGITLLKVDQL